MSEAPFDEDDHEHRWEPSDTDGLARCTADGCPVPERYYSAAERALITHWDECPAPPDAGCMTCHAAYRQIMSSSR